MQMTQGVGVSVDRIQQWYLAWNSRDWKTISGFVADHFVLEDMAIGMTVYGRSDYMRYCHRYAEAFPDGVIKIDRILTTTSDYAVVEYSAEGTQKGHFGLFEPSNRKVKMFFCDVLMFEGGKLAAVRTYGDLYRPLVEMQHIMSRRDFKAA